MIFFNIINSLFRTTYFELYQVNEVVKYKWDSPILVVVVTYLSLIAIYLLWKKKFSERININKLAVIFARIFSLCIVLLFRCEATCDSALVSDIVIRFCQKNYSSFEQGGYLYSYAFQLGFAALLEVIYQIFGIENFIVFQLSVLW